MEITNTKKYLFETMPVSKAIVSMAIPTIISQLIHVFYNMVDTFFIGRTGNSYMMAAVTVTFTLFMMNIAFANLFGLGGGSLIARLSGVRDFTNARKVSSCSFYFAMGIALLYSVILGAFLNPILIFLGASDATLLYARQYVIWVLVIGNFPMIMSLTLAHLLRNTGYAKQSSIGLSGGAVLNIILDPVLMFCVLPPGNEVTGAALATVISNFASCVYFLFVYIMMSKKAPLNADFRDIFSIRKKDLVSLFAVGIPSSFLTLLFDLANIVLNILVASYGDLELAAIGIVMKTERLPNAINIAICQGMLPIVAYNYASGNKDRMNCVIRTGRKYGLTVSLICIVILMLFAGPVVRIFLSTSAGNLQEALTTIGLGIIFLRIRCFASPVQFLNYHSSFCLQAMGKGKSTLLHAIVRELVFYIPLMFILNRGFGIHGLISAIIFGEGLGGAFALWLLHRARKA